jgi:hypothetical protein
MEQELEIKHSVYLQGYKKYLPLTSIQAQKDTGDESVV